MSRRWTGGALMALVLVMASCTSWQAQYLTGAANQAAMDEVEKRLGRPRLTWELTTGETLWTYRSGVPSGTHTGGMTIVGPGWVLGGRSDCTAYVLLFDRQKILRAWTQQPCKSARDLSGGPTSRQAPTRPPA